MNDLGLPAREIGRLTPRMFHALIDRHQARQRRGDMTLGTAVAWIVTASIGAPKDPIGASTIFPWLADAEPPISPEQNRANLETILRIKRKPHG